MSEGKSKTKRSSKVKRPVASWLKHPAETPMPEALRVDQQPVAVVTGRRLARGTSNYVAATPQSARAERRGVREDVVSRLLAVRADVHAGRTIVEAVADGTLWGWRAREALSDALGTCRLVQWDNEPQRTQVDRLALVERALRMYGHTEVAHRGGWTVTR